MQKEPRMEGPRLEVLRLEFWQGEDSMVQGDQSIRVTLEDAGGGPYYVFETARWSFDSPKEVEALLRQAEKAMEFLCEVNDELRREKNDE